MKHNLVRFLYRNSRAFSIIAVIIISSYLQNTFATTFEDVAHGDWNIGITWGGPCASGCNEGVDFPGPNDTAIINSHTVTLSSEQRVGNLTLSGGSLVSNSGDLVVFGDWINNGGVFQPNNGVVIFLGANSDINSGSSSFNTVVFGRNYGGVAVEHNGVFTNFFADSDSDEARGVALILAISTVISGDTVYLSSGTFDIGDLGIDLSIGGTGGFSIIGQGKHDTIITSGATQTPEGANVMIIQTGHQSITANLSIIAKGPYSGSGPGYLDGIKSTYAWGASSAINIDGSILYNVYIQAGSDGVYMFFSSYNNIYINNVDIDTVWDAVRTFDSGTVHINNSNFFVDIPDNNLGRCVASDLGTINIYNTSCTYNTTDTNSTGYAWYNVTDEAEINISNVTYGIGAGTGNTGQPTDAIFGAVVAGSFEGNTGPEITPMDTGFLSSGTSILTSDMTAHGDVIIAESSVLVAGSHIFTVGRNWENYGIFDYNTSTVNLVGTNQKILGFTAFYNFTKDISNNVSDTLLFQQDTNQMISENGTLTLKGAPSKILTLNSCDESGNQTSGNPQWGITVDATGTNVIADYLDVRDSDASSGKQIVATHSVNSGNTSNWTMPSANVTLNSAIYTVSTLTDGAGTITNVPYGTSKDTFEAALTKGNIHQTWNDANISSTVITGNTLVITAQDGITIATYTITVNADTRSNDASVTSAIYTVSTLTDGAGTITNVPYGTSKDTFEAALTKGNIHQTWNDIGISSTVVTENSLVVTAENGTTATYTITVNAAPTSGRGGGSSRKYVPPKNPNTHDQGAETRINMMHNSSFLYISEDSTIVSRLQEKYGNNVVTEEIYKNQCETKQGKTYYRQCALGVNFLPFSLLRDSIVCEGFIVQQTSEEKYHLESTASRKENVGIAVKMKKILGKNIDLIKPADYLNTFQDIGLPGQASWIQPVAETALKYGIISKNRTIFEPDRDVTRAEAFAMIMNSVCMSPTPDTKTDWRISLYNRAQKEGLTSRTWGTFEPNRSILRQELFSLVSRAADWAERTGGCDPKPAFCFLPE